MLYAIIKRFDSLREITGSMFPEDRKLTHLGINMMPRKHSVRRQREKTGINLREDIS